jgi:hypothetical protein
MFFLISGGMIGFDADDKNIFEQLNRFQQKWIKRVEQKGRQTQLIRISKKNAIFH